MQHRIGQTPQPFGQQAGRLRRPSLQSFAFAAPRNADGRGLEPRSVDEPAGMGGRSAFAVNKVQAAVDVLRLHRNHGTGAAVAATRDETLAMGVHNHKHAARGIGNDFPVVACAVQYGIGAFGCTFSI